MYSKSCIVQEIRRWSEKWNKWPSRVHQSVKARHVSEWHISFMDKACSSAAPILFCSFHYIPIITRFDSVSSNLAGGWRSKDFLSSAEVEICRNSLQSWNWWKCIYVSQLFHRNCITRKSEPKPCNVSNFAPDSIRTHCVKERQLTVTVYLWHMIFGVFSSSGH